VTKEASQQAIQLKASETPTAPNQICKILTLLCFGLGKTFFGTAKLQLTGITPLPLPIGILWKTTEAWPEHVTLMFAYVCYNVN
jgi:hypothetical protein